MSRPVRNNMRDELARMGFQFRDMSPTNYNRDNQAEKGHCPRCDTKTKVVKRLKGGGVRRDCPTCNEQYDATE